MDAVDVPDAEKKPPRLRYGRDAVLAAKDHALTTGLDIYDNLFRISSISQRGNRGKSKQTAFSKPQNDRSRDSSSIVLGPQKRTWNTGCHVSYSSREGAEGGSASIRGGKGNAEFRSGDKSYTRYPSDFKRDFRGGARERGGSRRADGTTFSRMYAREDRHRDHKYAHDEEPEWFSEGPATVNDTIELGRVMDELDDGLAKSNKTSHVSAPKGTEVDELPIGSEGEVTASKRASDSASNSGTSTESSRSPKAGESQGSRFKHLFSKTDVTVDVDRKPSSINEQLLKLLKGSSEHSSVLSPEKNNVLQVENKLRSLLLGNSAHRNSNSIDSINTEVSSSKPKILTVEEIEAQMNVPSNTAMAGHSTKCVPETENVENRHVDLSKFVSAASNPSANTVSSTSNLAPILQSLALKQHQSLCSKSVTMPNALNPFGILSNPMVRLPTSANAVSASARINQLQQVDLVGPNDMNNQGMLHQMWDSSPCNVSSTTSRTPAQPMSSMHQRGGGVPPGLLCELNSGSTLGMGSSHSMSSPNNLIPPRRPIVKVQQGLAGSHGSQLLSPLGSSNSNYVPQNFGPNMLESDRRFGNLASNQQLPIDGPLVNLAEKLQTGTMFPTASGDIRFANPNATQLTNPPLVPVASANNNNCMNNPYMGSRMGIMEPKSNNTLAFLSHLVDMDRSNVSRSMKQPSNLTSFLTLEEIEHQEVASHNTFF